MNLCVFASGSGSNLRAIIESSLSGYIKSKVVLVISNNSSSGAIETAAKFNIPFIHLSQKLFKSDKELTSRILDKLEEFKIDLIVLAGYMKLLSPDIIKAYRGRIINIHPALLPSYGGKGMFGINVHEAVIKAKEKVTGATVHFVDEVYDSGAIIKQIEVKVSPGDDAESLQEKVLKVEHKLYPEVIKMIEEKKNSG